MGKSEISRVTMCFNSSTFVSRQACISRHPAAFLIQKWKKTQPWHLAKAATVLRQLANLHKRLVFFILKLLHHRTRCTSVSLWPIALTNNARSILLGRLRRDETRTPTQSNAPNVSNGELHFWWSTRRYGESRTCVRVSPLPAQLSIEHNVFRLCHAYFECTRTLETAAAAAPAAVSSMCSGHISMSVVV